MTTLCLFRLGDQVLGVDATRVREVVPAATVTPVPGMPSGMAGVVNLRGEILTALDLRSCLGLRPAPTTGPSVVISGDRESVSLLVDEVCDVVGMGASQREAVSTTPDSKAGTLVLGAYQHQSGLVVELDVQALIDLATGEERTEQE